MIFLHFYSLPYNPTRELKWHNLTDHEDLVGDQYPANEDLNLTDKDLVSKYLADEDMADKNPADKDIANQDLADRKYSGDKGQDEWDNINPSPYF